MKGIEGSTLGRYELRRRVAQGGMAEVYLGYDRRVRRQVAIKVLYGRDESFVRRFEREALAVGTLSHDHILPLYDFGEQRPWYYLVMPYVEGGTLREYLLKRKRLTLQEAASFVDQIASALQYAHDQGVVHRDVKPSNILLRRDGYAYLVDFGLAKAMMGAESLTSAGAMVGTPEYMAPEQSNGLNDYRSDIYSLGVILYQMLTGRVPFMAESPVAISLKHIQTQPLPPREINSEIPQSIEEVILKAMTKDANERYQQAQELSAAYWKALQKEQARLKDEEPVPPSTSPVEAGSAATEEAQPRSATSSAVTKILKEAERVLAYPPITPLLFPLSEKSGPSQPSNSLSPGLSPGDISHKHRRWRPAFVTLLCCLLALALSIPLGVIWYGHSAVSLKPRQRIQSLGTTQIVPNLTATAETQVQLQATLAAQARVQATAGITSSISTGTVLYGDDLTTPGGGWVNDGVQCYFSPQGYHVQSFVKHVSAWCYSNQHQFSDAVITAQGQLLHGDIYGLVFRLSPINQEFYVLEINSTGEYRFVRAWGDNPLAWLTLIDWTHSNSIISGYGHTNTFLVLATGSQFRFYINKQLVVTNFSDAFYTSGMIGFLVGGDSVGGTEAVFSNVWVFQR
ncbi:MAG TPA: protein kinase [Ktedonobacteraceae bacterium]|nr:protein kinase [Ktedonobacteraceae bacterium]